MIRIKQLLCLKINNKKNKKQQLLTALKLSYYTRKKKLNIKKKFTLLKHIDYNYNIGFKSKLPNLYHNINFNWVLKR